jgi:hypothetical protein
LRVAAHLMAASYLISEETNKSGEGGKDV